MPNSESSAQVRVAIEDPSGVAEARRRIARLAAACGLDEASSGALALGVTEAATNIVKHARRGELIARALVADGAAGVEVLALDSGPGIANVAESLRDGHSTAGSPGTGLGTLARMTSAFELYSAPGKGTIVRFESWPREVQGRPSALGAICVPMEKELACGDGWALVEEAGRRVLFVVDGLGHGAQAAAAARAAIDAATTNARRAPAEIIAAVDGALRSTRGAAACVAVIAPGGGSCTFCGIGNISASIRAGGDSRSMVSHSGILGHQVRKIHEFQYPVPRGALCVLHSDGLATRWDLAASPGLEARHPSLIAAALYKDHRRPRDDVTVLACRLS